MNWGLNYNSNAVNGDPSRLNELKGAFQDIVANPKFDKMNFGLSVFSGAAQSNRGRSVAHGVTYPVSPIVGTDAQDILSENWLLSLRYRAR